jgi:hypothetical protein
LDFRAILPFEVLAPASEASGGELDRGLIRYKNVGSAGARMK